MQKRGKEDKMRGGGGIAKKNLGGMPERVKKTQNAGGGCCEKKIEGGCAGEG